MWRRCARGGVVEAGGAPSELGVTVAAALAEGVLVRVVGAVASSAEAPEPLERAVLLVAARAGQQIVRAGEAERPGVVHRAARLAEVVGGVAAFALGLVLGRRDDLAELAPGADA